MSQFMKNKKAYSLTAFLLILFLLPFIGANNYVLYIIGILASYSILVLGLNILVGYSGQVSVGHAGFATIGAIAVGNLLNAGLNTWLALIIGGIAAGIFGFLIGLPALRVSGMFLAVLTLAFGLAVTKAAMHMEALTGGFMGLEVHVQPPFLFNLPSALENYYLILLASGILIWSATKFLRTRLGRAFNAIRSGEIAASAMGVNSAKYKILAFVISGFYVGIGGGLITVNAGFLHPNDFNFYTSLLLLGMVVVGGQGSVLGSILGAILFGLIPELFANLQTLATAFVGFILIICLKVSPKGLSALIYDKLGYLMKERKKPDGAQTTSSRAGD